MKRIFFYLPLCFVLILSNLACNSENSSSKSGETQTENIDSERMTVTMRGKETALTGKILGTGQEMIDVQLTQRDMSEISLSDFKGAWILLNVFPSLDTSTCARSVREFNEKAANLENTKVLCISKDLPFAQSRFCSIENINNVIALSAFRSDFGEKYGLTIAEGPMKDLLARAVLVINPEGKVVYTELVAELSNEPNYDNALLAIAK